MSTRILITGISGYIGSHVLRALLAAIDTDVEIAGIDNFSTGFRHALLDQVTTYELDITDVKSVRSVLDEVSPQIIIHLAGDRLARSSQAAPRGVYFTNVCGTTSLCDAASSLKDPPAIIFSSSCSVYGNPSGPVVESAPINPVSPYGRSKAMCELILKDFSRAFGFQQVSLRYFNAAGHRAPALPDLGREGLIANALRAALTGNPLGVFGTDLPTPDGTCLRDYVSVEDIATAHVVLVRHFMRGLPLRHDTYNIASGNVSSVLEVIRGVERHVGKPIYIESRPAAEADPVSVSADPSRFFQDFGWMPEVSLDGILRSIADGLDPELYS